MKKKNYASPFCKVHFLDEDVVPLLNTYEGKEDDKKKDENTTPPSPPVLRIDGDDNKTIDKEEDILW